jgi:hypothetical protein
MRWRQHHFLTRWRQGLEVSAPQSWLFWLWQYVLCTRMQWTDAYCSVVMYVACQFGVYSSYERDGMLAAINWYGNAQPPIRVHIDQYDRSQVILPNRKAALCSCFKFISSGIIVTLSSSGLTFIKTTLNSVALVGERTIPIERLPLVGKVSAKFCRGFVDWWARRFPTAVFLVF